jgi:hypothetical protein
MRKTLLAAVSFATSLATLFAASAGPAAADPARASAASAYGLSASGLLPISPTITTSSAFPPGGDNNANAPLSTVPPTLLTVPLGTLVLAGAVGVTANAHQADDITPALVGVPNQPCGGTNCSEPTSQTPDNTRGLAKTAGLGVVFNPNPANIPGGQAAADAITTLMQRLGGLVTADAVTAEAVARCVNNQPSFDVGFQVAGLGGLVGGIVNSALQPALDVVIGLVGPGAPLSSVVSVTPGVTTLLADGVAIDGLRVDIGLLNVHLAISHAEAHMPPGCGVAVAKPPTGPGGVAPAGRLASTGSDVPFLPLGLGLVGAAVLTGGVARRSRRRATVTQ